jgi:hypothetical protein
MDELSPQSGNAAAYRLAGLRIVSELALPGVMACNNEIPAGDEILIRRSRLPESLSSATAVFPQGQCNENELLLNIPGAARYLIRGGKEILVDQTVISSPGDVAAFLLGTAFGVLCHQRGIPPLHASAIDVTDGCVAFVGDSGMGKSTLVAALATRGHQVIADDVCFLQRSEQGQVRAWPGINQLRLCEDALKALGCDGPGVERASRGPNKYLIPLRPPRNAGDQRRLRRVYQLDSAADGDFTSIHRLRGAAAVEVLMQNIYRSRLAEHMGRKPAAFVVCAAATRDVPVFRFRRPLGFHALRSAVDILEDHLRDLQ